LGISEKLRSDFLAIRGVADEKIHPMSNSELRTTNQQQKKKRKTKKKAECADTLAKK
jgi:hypothetical protein